MHITHTYIYRHYHFTTFTRAALQAYMFQPPSHTYICFNHTHIRTYLHLQYYCTATGERRWSAPSPKHTLTQGALTPNDLWSPRSVSCSYIRHHTYMYIHTYIFILDTHICRHANIHRRQAIIGASVP